MVLPHEHLLANLTQLFTEPGNPDLKTLARQKLSLENLSFVRYHQMECLDNLVLDDVRAQIDELLRYKAAGGGTVVELTPMGVGRNIDGLAAISAATGLHVVAGTGVYLDQFQTNEMRSMTAEQIGEILTREITTGIGDGTIRAGILGEMGCSWPLAPTEDKALRGAVLAHQATGAAISIHPGRHPDAPKLLLKLLESAGARLDKVVMCHLDRTLPHHEGLVELARSGCFMEFDLFGQESSYTRYGPVELPNDATRIERIVRLIDDGFADQILLSLDIAVKHLLTAYGGHGYAHILERVVPKMYEAGLKQPDIHKMLVSNPAQMLML